MLHLWGPIVLGLVPQSPRHNGNPPPPGCPLATNKNGILDILDIFDYKWQETEKQKQIQATFFKMESQQDDKFILYISTCMFLRTSHCPHILYMT